MTYEELTAAALFLAEVEYKSARNAKRDHVSSDWIAAARDDAYQAWEVYGDEVTCKTGFTIERGGFVEDVSDLPGIMARLDRQFPAAAAKRLAEKAGCTVVWDKQSEPMSPVRDGSNCRHTGDGVVKLADGREYRFNAYDFGRGPDFILRYLTNADGSYSTKRGHEIPPNRLLAVRAAVSAAIAVELAKISKARREAFLANQEAAFGAPLAGKIEDRQSEAWSHNADKNPDWTPLVAWRVFACEKCGTETKMQTNHTGTVWSARCVGTCRRIANPHTANEKVSEYYGPHHFVREA